MAERYSERKIDGVVRQLTRTEALEIVRSYGLPEGRTSEEITGVQVVQPLMGEQASRYVAVTFRGNQTLYSANHHRTWVDGIEKIPRRSPQRVW